MNDSKIMGSQLKVVVTFMFLFCAIACKTDTPKRISVRLLVRNESVRFSFQRQHR